MSATILAQPGNKSMLFHFFNLARAKAAGLDRKRVNRALGYVQAGRVELQPDLSAIAHGEDGATYRVTKHGCTCPDHMHRGTTCKHQICRFLLLRMAEAQRQARGPEPTPPPPMPPAPPLDREARGTTTTDDIDLLFGRKAA